MKIEINQDTKLSLITVFLLLLLHKHPENWNSYPYLLGKNETKKKKREILQLPQPDKPKKKTSGIEWVKALDFK